MPYDYKIFQAAALPLRAINNGHRKLLIELLAKKGEMDVSSIYKSLKWEQPVASQHLAILRRAGIVKTRRDGKWIYYSINEKRMKELMEFAKKIIE
jgi:DNA-binding transcriptional ArsR family regulator